MIEYPIPAIPPCAKCGGPVNSRLFPISFTCDSCKQRFCYGCRNGHICIPKEENVNGTAIQDLIARVEKLEQFKTRLAAPMIGVQHLLMRVEELEKQAKHERFNDAMRQLNQDWEDADPIQAAILAERERCAKLIEEYVLSADDSSGEPVIWNRAISFAADLLRRSGE